MRGIRIAEEYINSLGLDLSDLVILTEAGSGHYIYSPLIALLSNAKKVIVISPDSKWATHNEKKQRILGYMDKLRLEVNRIDILKDRKEPIRDKIDIFLNLGFVRPIDEIILSYASEKAVVAYMCESWEWRNGDVDRDACRIKSIPIVGVNENFSGFNIFESCSQLLLKMLFDAGQEVANCKYIVIGDKRFGEIAYKALQANNATCFLLHSANKITIDILRLSDAIITADYVNTDNILAGIKWTPKQIKEINPNLEIIQFAGHIDVADYIEVGICVHPAYALPPQRMVQTLAHLGPRPVIGLHCLGIKAAEVVYKKNMSNIIDVKFSDLIQPIL
jgi:hypothetical protein